MALSAMTVATRWGMAVSRDGPRQDGYFNVGRGEEAGRRKKASCTTAARLQAEVRDRDPG